MFRYASHILYLIRLIALLVRLTYHRIQALLIFLSYKELTLTTVNYYFLKTTCLINLLVKYNKWYQKLCWVQYNFLCFGYLYHISFKANKRMATFENIWYLRHITCMPLHDNQAFFQSAYTHITRYKYCQPI